MEEEWNLLERSLEKDKLTIVTGLRRYGKTSLILTYLNEIFLVTGLESYNGIAYY
ncbi:hypothetical protein [Desulfurococcus amylolyticus]|uniref:hypothetical protein n=1 Tax=Desulfurococcus amylolyticus TaxID=94694 RepID=UPI000AF4BC36|nr:hypothetical protein [Desulfurococcus amylolyticus]